MMVTRRDLREKLGLSQELMGLFMGVSRPHCAMIEAGKRSPSNDATTRLGWLQQELQKQPKALSPRWQIAIKELVKKDQEIRLSKISEIEFEIRVLQRELDSMYEQYNQAVLMLQVAYGLRQYPEIHTSPHNMTWWINAREEEAFTVLSANSEMKQKMLLAKIKSLQSQLQELSTL